MRIGGSLVLIALGAVLRWGITYRHTGVNIPTIGMILIVVGLIGMLATLILMSTRRRTDVIRHEDVDSIGAPAGRARSVSHTTYVEPRDTDPSA